MHCWDRIHKRYKRKDQQKNKLTFTMKDFILKLIFHSSFANLFCEYDPCSTSSKFFIYLYVVLHRFQHCTGHITTGSWKGRGNQYIQLVKVLYCKLPTNSKQLPAFPLETMLGTEPRPQRWEARVLPLCHRGPLHLLNNMA